MWVITIEMKQNKRLIETCCSFNYLFKKISNLAIINVTKGIHCIHCVKEVI